MKISWFPYFETPTDGSGGGLGAPRKEVSDSDTALLDQLLEGKEEKPKKEEKKEEEDLIDDDNEEIIPEKEEDKEEDSIEEDEVEEEINVDNNRGLDLKKIKEKYPDFAKTNEFRELRNAYYREAQLTEIFPTIDDAREAAENNETYEKLNDSIINKSDPTVLFNAIKENSPESLKKFSLNILDSINEIDKNLYIEVISPVVKRLARQINAEGRRYLSRNAESEEGQALVATARNIMQYAFEDASLVDKDDEIKNPKVSEKEKELSEREQKLAQEKFNSAFQVVVGSAEKHLDRAIREGLDPDNKFNDFTRDSLVEKIKTEVRKQLDSDSLHIKRMNSLWKRAEKEGFDRKSLSSIVSAFLERARPIISTTRTKYKGIALKGKTTESNEDKRELKIASRGQSGRAPASDGRTNMRSVDTRKIDYSKTSDDDIFEGRVKLKG